MTLSSPRGKERHVTSPSPPRCGSSCASTTGTSPPPERLAHEWSFDVVAVRAAMVARVADCQNVGLVTTQHAEDPPVCGPPHRVLRPRSSKDGAHGRPPVCLPPSRRRTSPAELPPVRYRWQAPIVSQPSCPRRPTQDLHTSDQGLRENIVHNTRARAAVGPGQLEKPGTSPCRAGSRSTGSEWSCDPAERANGDYLPRRSYTWWATIRCPTMLGWAEPGVCGSSGLIHCLDEGWHMSLPRNREEVSTNSACLV